jgi:hypothetical protein
MKDLLFSLYVREPHSMYLSDHYHVVPPPYLSLQFPLDVAQPAATLSSSIFRTPEEIGCILVGLGVHLHLQALI